MIRARLIASLIGLALLVALLVFGPQACSAYLSAKKQGQVSAGQGKAAIDAGANAVEATGKQMKSEQQSRDAAQEAVNEIRKQPAGHSNDAAVRAACRLREYHDSERCAALRAADLARSQGSR